MPKPACVKCKMFYRPKRNGVAVTESMPTQTGARAGEVDAALWKPYKLWEADLWHCLGCGHELIAGWGGTPLTEHYKDNFAKLHALSQFTINDC